MRDNRKMIRWSHPEYPPVVSVPSATPSSQLALVKPTTPGCVRQTLMLMGLIATCLTAVTPHVRLRGAAREVAHLPTKGGMGVTTREIREALGHSHAALARRTPDSNIGDSTRELFNDRAEQRYFHPRQAFFAHNRPYRLRRQR